MKITKQELIDLDACAAGLERFIEQTDNTEDEVDVVSLVGGKNTYSDLLWLAGEKLPEERIVRFACDCALINIEKIKPYTNEYDMIVGFLRNPTGDRRASVAGAAARAGKDVAARAAANAGNDDDARTIARAATYAAYTALYATYSAYTGNAAVYSDDAARSAAKAAGNCEEVNKLLRELFA